MSAGRFTSSWRLIAPDGTRFGDTIEIQYRVSNKMDGELTDHEDGNEEDEGKEEREVAEENGMQVGPRLRQPISPGKGYARLALSPQNFELSKLLQAFTLSLKANHWPITFVSRRLYAPCT